MSTLTEGTKRGVQKGEGYSPTPLPPPSPTPNNIISRTEYETSLLTDIATLSNLLSSLLYGPVNKITGAVRHGSMPVPKSALNKLVDQQILIEKQFNEIKEKGYRI